MTYKFLDLPEVPEDLILPVEEVLQLENIFGGETKNYTIHECQDELREYLKELFPERENFVIKLLLKEFLYIKTEAEQLL